MILLGTVGSHSLLGTFYRSTDDLHQNGQDSNILLPYMTRLRGQFCLPLLILNCNELTEIEVCSKGYSVADILTLCRANPLFEELYYYSSLASITDRAHTYMSTPTYTQAPI